MAVNNKENNTKKIKTIDQFLDSYMSKINYPEFLNGLNGEIKSTKEMSDEDINIIFRYMESEQNLETNLINEYTDKEVIAVAMGLKKVAMTDNDTALWEIDSLDTSLRFALILYGGVKTIVENDKVNDDNTIYYYKEENWHYAMLLYLFHRDLTKEMVKEIIFPSSEMSHEDFDIFQSYLLGYTPDSVVYFLLDGYKSETSFSATAEKYSSNKNTKTKREIYDKFYNANEDRIKYLFNRHKQIKKICDKYLNEVLQNEEYKTFAIGINLTKQLTLQKPTVEPVSKSQITKKN